jgi:hypothetical protein
VLELPKARRRAVVADCARHQPRFHRSEDRHELGVIKSDPQKRLIGVGVDRLCDSSSGDWGPSARSVNPQGASTARWDLAEHLEHFIGGGGVNYGGPKESNRP